MKFGYLLEHAWKNQIQLSNRIGWCSGQTRGGASGGSQLGDYVSGLDETNGK